MTTQHSAVAGLRTVAAFEAAKGLLVLATGLGLLSLLHQDVQRAAESVVRHLHLNPARHYPRVFLEAAAQVTDTRLWLLASGAFAYAVVRAVEAYGLWRTRAWAAWLAVLSGTIYLPVEIYELIHHATALKGVILLSNVGIASYVGYVRLIRHPRQPLASLRSDRSRRELADVERPVLPRSRRH
jgi:uncharacterized membrane protein (DUF2068 family)